MLICAGMKELWHQWRIGASNGTSNL